MDRDCAFKANFDENRQIEAMEMHSLQVHSIVSPSLMMKNRWSPCLCFEVYELIPHASFLTFFLRSLGPRNPLLDFENVASAYAEGRSELGLTERDGNVHVNVCALEWEDLHGYRRSYDLGVPSEKINKLKRDLSVFFADSRIEWEKRFGFDVCVGSDLPRVTYQVTFCRS